MNVGRARQIVQSRREFVESTLALGAGTGGRPTQITSSKAWLALPPTKQGDAAVLRFELGERDDHRLERNQLSRQ